MLALGANIAVALVSREVTDDDGGVDGDRLFDVTLSNDRTLVTGVARQLLSRMLIRPTVDGVNGVSGGGGI